MGRSYPEISVEEARLLVGEARFVDVREPDEYVGELGHIAGAELVPLASVATAAAAWDRKKPLVLVCRSGARSGRAAAALFANGFKQPINMSGGMLAWTASGFPVERGGGKR